MIHLEVWLSTLVPILACMAALWILSLLLKNTAIVDIFWGLGFVLIFWLTYARSPLSQQPKTILLGLMVTIWGFRLAIHILFRNIGKGEDARYAQFRANNGVNWWWNSLFKVFVLQGLLIWIIAAPISIMQVYPSAIGPLSLLGFGIWLLGFLFETIGDLQLVRFKSDPTNKGQLLTSGLWALTRHPNYFGDATQWWGFWIVSLTLDTWWTIFSPILITFLLLNFSGVPITEKMLNNKNPDYHHYVKTVPKFIPNLINISRRHK